MALVLAILAWGWSGCLLSPQPDPPGMDSSGRDDAGSGGDARDDATPWDGHGEAEAGADADADADADTAADAETSDGATEEDGGGFDYDENCPTDPADGRTGEPCESDDDCGGGFSCVPEYTDSDPAGTAWTDYPGGYCVPRLPPGEVCDVTAAGACPSGARCVRAGLEARCLDACSAASLAGEAYGANCDCRAGYRCDMSLEVCVPGCVADHECCAEWVDWNADDVRQVDELEPMPGCAATCDPHTFECVYVAAPDAAVGDACTLGADCPAGARCWRSLEAAAAGQPGVCLVERCDLAGRLCPEGSSCITKDPGLGFASFCARPCDPDAPPGGLREPCAAGTVCLPVVFDGTTPARGACLPAL
ncbi:MAG: hypothetical protein HY907_11620 [Deltaproteobacteria bacterium]|nr:hypothetical protein [Deltaproteobacteria bacterium]